MKERKVIKKIDEFILNNKTTFEWSDDGDVGVGQEELQKLDEISNDKIKKVLNNSKISNGRKLKMDMSKFRNRILKSIEDGIFDSNYDEVNELHNNYFGCDFEPKF